MIRKISILLIWVFTLFLIIGISAILSDFTYLTILIGLFWSIAVFKGWRTVCRLMIVIVYLWSVTLLHYPSKPIWIVLASGTGLIAWDLSLFHQTLNSVVQIRQRKRLVQKHVFQLALLCLCSSLLIWAGTVVNLKLSFVAVTMLVLILVWLLRPARVKDFPQTKSEQN